MSFSVVKARAVSRRDDQYIDFGAWGVHNFGGRGRWGKITQLCRRRLRSNLTLIVRGISASRCRVPTRELDPMGKIIFVLLLEPCV